MANRLDEWQQEAARRADTAVVPVLMTGEAMEFDIWFGSVGVDEEVPLQEPDRSQFVSDEDVQNNVNHARRRQWSEWQQRHHEDLYIAFCSSAAQPGVLSCPTRPLVKGPFTPAQTDKILGGYRVAATGQVPERFVARMVRIAAIQGELKLQTASQQKNPTLDNSWQGYRFWFEYCVIFLGITFFLFGLLDFTPKNVVLVMVLAAGAALVNWAFRPEGPYDPNSSIMWPAGSPRRKRTIGLIVVGFCVVVIIVLSLVRPP